VAFSEADRVQIRLYLGFGSLYLQADPRLENAITALQSVTDGGTRPTNDAELVAKGILTELADVDSRIKALRDQQAATEVVGELRLDAAREQQRLCTEGRRYVHRLSRMLDTFPRSDAFGPAPILTATQDARRSAY
jgi:hypothetical protein